MVETNPGSWGEAATSFRIVALNNDKTRKIDGSDAVYDVYFELSGTPTQEWGTLFDGEWKELNPTQPDLWQAASIERGFLVMRCPLQQVVSMHLPFLKKAVSVTNVKYLHYVQEVVKERQQRHQC